MSTDPDRDPALAVLWREHSTETPPPHVDAAILAAAHRATASAPHGRERWLGPRAWRWWMPLAAAAVIAVVVVGVKPPSQTLVDDAVQSATDMPATPAEKPVATPAPEPKVATAPGEQSATAPREQRAKSVEPRVAQGGGSNRQQPAPAAPPVEAFATPSVVAPVAPPVAAFATPPAAPRAAAGPRTEAAPAGTAPGSSAAPSERASRAAQDRGAALELEAWFARIRAVRDLGREEEATRELARFRAAYPDADTRLPADLREWANRMPR